MDKEDLDEIREYRRKGYRDEDLLFMAGHFYGLKPFLCDCEQAERCQQLRLRRLYEKWAMTATGLLIAAVGFIWYLLR